MPTGKPIILETISVKPRLFRLLNFFTDEEADAMINNVLTTSTKSHMLKRSTTGAIGGSLDNRRTSKNGYDISSEVAMQVKKRAFDLLGIFPFEESLVDGIQVLHYNRTQAYSTHIDYIDPTMLPNMISDSHRKYNELSLVDEDDSRKTKMMKTVTVDAYTALTQVAREMHDWDSSRDGTNRFATIFLYLSDVEEGGETVFTELYTHNDDSGTPPKPLTKEQVMNTTMTLSYIQ